ncbi:hypothetical protein EYF80_066017 [Liparis tanakae]|uniref:Uncharacterized protein n=1 Tax=Liparis tanakae TaxID=230148 RepID=A0A4Z2E524_9TELE|nr:hypothetical protein EYF80_066017 [Liparis tanakae]
MRHVGLDAIRRVQIAMRNRTYGSGSCSPTSLNNLDGTWSVWAPQGRGASRTAEAPSCSSSRDKHPICPLEEQEESS